jgi:hypothetical protein
MRAHIDVLGWLFAIVGALGALTGVSLAVMAVGMMMATATGSAGGTWAHPVVRVLAGGAAVLVVGGGALVAVGRGVARRQRRARPAALVAAAANLCLLPFGTALGAYAFWVLLNDEAREAFGRPRRVPVPRG